MTQERKTVAVDKELAEKLSDIAKREGKTIFSYINDLIKSAIESAEIKESFVEILEKQKNFNLTTDVGFTLTPLKLENFSLSIVFNDEINKNKLLNQWHNWGSWLGNYIKARFPKEEFEYIKRISNAIFVSGEVFEIDDNNINELTIRIYGNVMGEERTYCLAAAYEGIFEEFGYKTTLKDVSRGICRLILKK
ncbi:MAG: hypothetical protein EAX96_03430 [Candidatus Lokiarchaeota archaeon]|nr:hypothetical protein [Candidatus Lokiarchaeota archaeon]